jgi:2-oxoglutarate dehydrogenase E2 component (dihydrolipoamide succinyltransferase)
MALPDGNLIVPVIHQADQKNILEIAHRTRELEERAQKGKLMVADVQKEHSPCPTWGCCLRPAGSPRS